MYSEDLQTNDVIDVAEYVMETTITLTKLAMLQLHVALLVSCKRRASKNISDVVLLELQVAVLLILHLRFC